MPIESLRRETLLESGGPAPGSRERPRCDRGRCVSRALTPTGWWSPTSRPPGWLPGQVRGDLYMFGPDL